MFQNNLILFVPTFHWLLEHTLYTVLNVVCLLGSNSGTQIVYQSQGFTKASEAPCCRHDPSACMS
jgi:hypothetical protein